MIPMKIISKFTRRRRIPRRKFNQDDLKTRLILALINLILTLEKKRKRRYGQNGHPRKKPLMKIFLATMKKTT